MANLTASASGNMASFWTPKQTTITSCKVYFSPKQEGSGDPSPENVRNITGWDGISVTDNGENGKTANYNVDWSSIGTLYGGYVDLVSGELTIDHSVLTIDGAANWKVVATNKFYFEGIANDVFNNQNATGELSNLYPYAGVASSSASVNTDKHFYLQHSPKNPARDTWYNRVWAYDTNYTLDTFKEMLNSTPLQVTYQMRYPVTYQLDSRQLSSFIGHNNLWTNADHIEVEYEYIESMDMQLAKKKMALTAPHLSIASGSVATFETDMSSKLKECKIYFKPVQTGEGDPSPENVRSISGHDGLTIYHAQQPIPIEYIQGTNNHLGVDWTVDSYGLISATGNPTSWASRQFGEIEVNGDELVRLKFFGDMNNATINMPTLYDTNRNRITVSGADNVLNNGLDLSQYSGAKYLVFSIKRIANNVQMSGSCFGVFTLDGSVPTADTIQVDWNSVSGTLYGGYVDLVSGVLVQTHNMIQVKDLEWRYDSNGQCFYSYGIKSDMFRNDDDIISDSYITAERGISLASYVTAPDCSVKKHVPSDDTKIIIKDARYTTPTDLIANMGEAKIIYNLAEPITYTISPETINTIKGKINNIWNTGNGSTSLKFWTHYPYIAKGHKNVTWNQMVNGYMTNVGWGDRNTAESTTTFSNGIATVDLTNSVGSYHTMISRANLAVQLGHVYYVRYDYNINISIPNIGAEFAQGRQVTSTISDYVPNTWSSVSMIRSATKDGTGILYIPFTRYDITDKGLIAQIKNPFYIDLTLMFGEGNEPETTEEFEAICENNGIDFSKPYPQDGGTVLTWKI